MTPRSILAERRPRGAMTIFEIVVALAVVTIIAAIVLPFTASYNRHARVDTAATTLKTLGSAIRTFRGTVGNYPGRASDLAVLIAATDKTSCNTANPTIVTYGATNAAKWSQGGPFYSRALSRTGFPIGIGTVQDSLARTSTNTTSGTLQILISNVKVVDARDLNTEIDGEADTDQPDGSNTSGAVQWSVPSGDAVLLTYGVPVGNSC